jgi:hypothetical protein
VSTGTVILLVIVLVLVALGAALASTATRGRGTRRAQEGPERGRLARGRGPRQARAELASRRRRVDGMGIRPLSGERRSGYVRQWTAVQERFIDSPAQAVATAAGLVTAVAAERGYDVSDPGQLLADLSVYHGRHIDGYRRATRATDRAAAAPTEELRQALLGHRALFQDLLEGPDYPRHADGDHDASAGRRGAWRQVVPSLHRGGRRRERDEVAPARS